MIGHIFRKIALCGCLSAGLLSLSGCYVVPAPGPVVAAPPPPPPAVVYGAAPSYYPAGYYAAPAAAVYPSVAIGFGGCCRRHW